MADAETLGRWARINSNLRIALAEVRPSQVPQIQEFLDHNELGLAFEDIVAELADRDAALFPHVKEALAAAADEMGLAEDPAWLTLCARQDREMTSDQVQRSVLAFLDQFISRGGGSGHHAVRDRLARGDPSTLRWLDAELPNRESSEREAFDSMRRFLEAEWERNDRRRYPGPPDLGSLLDWTEWEPISTSVTSDPGQWYGWLASIKEAERPSE